MPGFAAAQIGVIYPYPNNIVVGFDQNEIGLSGLSIGSPEMIPIPKSVLSIQRTARIDTLSDKYIISERYYGDQYKIPLILEKSQIVSLTRKSKLDKLWYTSSSGPINSFRASGSNSAKQPRGFNIRVPVPLASQRLDRLVGGGGAIGLNVAGEVNITGNLMHNDRSQVKDVFRGSDYTFRLQQTQQFRITGMVGSKINVTVDQNSERDFDIQNNLRIIYTGEEDEIFQSIQAGNISLSLPGTKFITFSGGNKGLFGFKTINKFGPLDITSIASLERGEKKSLVLQGGAQAQKQIIKDYNYVRGMYFFVDTRYKDNYRLDSNGFILYVENDEIVEFELWMSDRNFNTNPDAKEAWAVWNPNAIAEEDTLLGGDQNNMKRHFKRLIPNKDYVLFKDAGYIIMERPVRNEVLALAYKPKVGGPVGDILPPDELPVPENRPFILKLLRNDNPQPTDLTWALEWKNVYFLGTQGVNKDGFTLQIVLSNTAQRTPLQDTGDEFIDIFGLDRKGVNGEPRADGLVDVAISNFFDFGRGHLIMPGRRPFDPVDGKDPLGGSSGSKLSPEHRIPEIYDQLFVNPADYNRISQFDIEVSYSNRSQTYNLGFNIIQDSEEVYLDGQRLMRGTDYEIDYGFGQITILNQDAMLQGSRLEVKYESGEIFRLDKKTLFGTHMNYSLGDLGFIGGTALFLNERIIDTRVTVGQGPKQNLAWGVNSSLKFESGLLSTILDKIPIIRADKASLFNFEGEFAQSRPNPNTLNSESTGDPTGVAYLDDFEGTKRISFLGIQRRNWTYASQPILKDPDSENLITFEQENRAKMLWYNPYQQVHLNEIFPNKEVNDRTQNLVHVLNVRFIKDTRGNFPDNPWGGIMQWLGPSYFNQSESKFLEMWVKGEQGVIHIDLGRISEDAVPNLSLDTEDGITTQFLDDNVDPDEDVGLWNKWNQDHENTPEMQWDDNWDTIERSDNIVTDFGFINGTKGNAYNSRGKIDGNRKPDTEDIDKDGALDLRNDFFQFTIDIGNDAVSGMYKVSGPNENGWKLYRVPLDDFVKVGKPDWTQIEYARLWFTGIPEEQIVSIYNVDLVGNSWKELGVAESDTLVKSGKYVLSDTLVQVDAVNTEDNLGEYTSPPGVEGEFDRIAQIHAREQALALRFTNLQSGHSAAARSVFVKDRNIIHYRKLKMFLYGDPRLTIGAGDSLKVEFYMQFGFDDNNYYEVRKKIYPGWDERNEVNVDLWDLPKLKIGEYAETGIKVLENGERWTVKGNPTLQKLRIITIGVKNLDDFPVTGFIWVNELRVSEVDRAPGNAYRANLSVNLSNLGSITMNFSRREANFHTLNEQFGSLQNTNSYSFYLRSFSLEKLIPALGMFSVPMNYSVVRSDAIPKYLQGSDILYAPDIENASNEEVHKENVAYSTGFSVKPFSKNWLIKNTIEALRLNFSRQTSNSRDVNHELNHTETSSGQVSHSLNLGTHSIRPFWFFGDAWLLGRLSKFKFYFTPGPISTQLTAKESVQEKKLRIKNTNQQAKKTDVNTLTATRIVKTSYTPIENLSFSFSRSNVHDFSNLENKMNLFSELFNDTSIVSTKQDFSGNYTPKILTWMSPNLRYNATYGLDRNRQLADAGKKAVSNRTLTASFKVSFNELIGKVYKLPGSEQPRTRRPPRRRAGGAQEVPPEQEEEQSTEQSSEKSTVYLLNPLWYISQFTSRIAPINVSLSQKRMLQSVGLEENPSLGYQFGFDEDPGVSIVDKLGKNTGSESNNSTLTAGTSINLARILNFTLRFTDSNTITDKGNNRSGNSSRSMLIFGDTRIPMFEYGLQVNNLQDFSFISTVTDNVSLSHNYSGRRTLNWVGSEENPSSERFEWGFQPLANVRILWKKGINSSISMDRGNSFTIDKTGAERKEHTNRITVTTSFQWNTGFRIPLPIGWLRRKRINNSVKFNVNFETSSNVSLEKKPNDDKFHERNNTSGWNVTPTLNYSFTDKVIGGFNFRWQVNESKVTGRNTTKDFGLFVKIKIAG